MKNKENKTNKSEIAKKEEEILKFWEENKIFEKTLEQGKNKPVFSFYDGPPFATGLPHYGHILASIIKDAIPRYQTMRGKNVPRRWGWDCHGLPIENLVEKDLRLKSKKDIEEYGIEKFNKKAEESVLEYADEWKKIIPRIGRWVDMENDYKTMDRNYTESVWRVFKTLYDKGLIYEGHKSMHVCPRCETTLSNFEVTQNYKEIKDIAVTVKFELEDEPDTYVLAWTTTPWTLPGNVALAINHKVIYCKIKSQKSNLKNNEYFILAKDRIDDILKDKEYKIIQELKGKDLIGKKYKPLFNYYSKDKKLENSNNGWRIYSADFVNTEDGTGIVHIAPAFGENDMELGKKEKLPFIQHVGMDGKFKPEVEGFAGLQVKPKGNPRETDEKIIEFLGDKVFNQESISHSYPFCWRCETPLLNYAASSWFVNVEKIKGQLLENNKKINWIPANLRDGRFGKWLEGARDWAISRSRYWGAPLPVWRCEKCGEIKVIGSAEEVGKIDLHRPHIDKIEFQCDCGEKMKRVPEVFDCWFESGSMPYAQKHYPFENKEEFEKTFPAEFIAEGVDQTRGWFYTLLVLSTALFDKPAYKNVVANGIILAEDGQKMSKRLKNYPDPMDIVEKYGADALRFYLLSSPAVRAESLNFSEKGVDEVNKKIIMRLKNVLAFYKMYTLGNPVSAHLETGFPSVKNILDKWILARLNQLTQEITEAMENYELDKAARPLGDFVDDLSTWYIRRSRSRFKEEGEDKNNVVSTTCFVLVEFSKLLAPFAPFAAEEIYQELGREKESVHLEEWPESGSVDVDLLTAMSFVRSFASIALMERAKHNIKVRQPLQRLSIKHNGEKVQYWSEVKDILAAEVNVKEVMLDATMAQDDPSVKLDIIVTSELKDEGMMRELVRNIQDLRKKAGLMPGQEIDLVVETDYNGEKLIKKFESEIKKGTNTALIEFSENDGEEIKIEELKFIIKIIQ
ncbi:isoleucine--tRNA ligase [Patescibacteria group bacterium]|nr:isoleucine--tRNA ligase [Patescibacteria group bacterium]MBU4353237.1 isoleucine--tRNA ligase [Patescibacteria group bacterium]MBU4477133.1 isoleucine--tRNA ligase [Patescibacteria group bacterium]MCG2698938.1 isoleucine--tRNA ligase [Candidatus Parcubacteria bacterium]